MQTTPMDEQYPSHPVFQELETCAEFYNGVSYIVMDKVTMGVETHVNIDTYVFSSIEGTIRSIKLLLEIRRIGDAYALLRKYKDVILINTYSMLFLRENHNIENFVVEQINKWFKGTDQIPTNRIINTYLEKSTLIKSIRNLLEKDNRYSLINERANDFTHSNYYSNLMLNDNEVFDPRECLPILDAFKQDIRNLFIQHFAYIFTINDWYMQSPDHVDYLDLGQTPPENSQYFVAPFIQEAFDSILKKDRPDLATEIKSGTMMQLE
jgi:hypothetical protein